MRKFIIFWYPKPKYDWQDPDIRKIEVAVSKPTGEIGVDAQTALRLGMRSFGSLNKIEISKIIEIDENGNQIGEDITPGKEYIVPSA